MKTRYGTLIKSDNALEAESKGRYSISEGTRRLRDELQRKGIKVTLRNSRKALEEFGNDGEWHHVGKFASEVNYYDVSAVVEMLDEPESRQKLLDVLEEPLEEKARTKAEAAYVIIKWSEWAGSRYRRCTEHEWIGTAQIKGDWIYFDGRRKKLSGNWIEVTHIPKARAKVGEERRLQLIEEEKRNRLIMLARSVKRLETEKLARLWRKRQDDRRGANRQICKAIGLTVAEDDYVMKIGSVWQVLEDELKAKGLLDNNVPLTDSASTERPGVANRERNACIDAVEAGNALLPKPELCDQQKRCDNRQPGGRKMLTTTQRFYGARETRRARALAEKNNWSIEIIENANGCFGMYARTDAIVTRPLTGEEAMARTIAIKKRLSVEKCAARIDAVVPRDVLNLAFTNNRGNARISIEACLALDLVTPHARETDLHVDFGLVLKCNWPTLTPYERFLIYTNLKRQGPFVWDIPSEQEVAELRAEMAELEEAGLVSAVAAVVH